MNTGYADYVIAQIEEILDLYDGDGLFIDIVRYFEEACVCATCLEQMIEQGIDPEDPEQLRRFTLDAARRFMARTTETIQAKDPDPTAQSLPNTPAARTPLVPSVSISGPMTTQSG